MLVINKIEHDLHIVLNSKMKNKLKKIARKRKTSLSKLVVFIIKKFLEVKGSKRYYFGPEDGNKYPEVHWDKHMHIYMTKDDYRYFKKLHSDLNFFSMAKLVRWLLEWFIKEYEEHGWDWILKNNTKEKNELLLEIKKLKKWWKDQQLSHFESNKFPVLKVIYNSNHQVLGFQTYF